MLTMICLVVGTVLCFVIGGFCLNDYQHKWADLAAAVSMMIGIVGINRGYRNYYCNYSSSR